MGRRYVILIITLFCVFESHKSNAQFLDDLAFKIHSNNFELIGLGEESHNDNEYNMTKLRLIDSINKYSDVSTIMFESPFVDATVAYIENKDYGYFVYPFWRTKLIFDPLSEFLKRYSVIAFGFDVQENCKFKYFNKFLLSNNYIYHNTSIIKSLAQIDSLFSIAIAQSQHSKVRRLTELESKLLINELMVIKNNIKEKDSKPIFTPLLMRCIDNRINLATFLTLPIGNERVRFRDKVMAENVLFLCKYFKLKGKTSILWSANSHIAKKNAFKNGWSHDDMQGMGEILSDTLKKLYFSIGISSKKRPKQQFDYFIRTHKKSPISGFEFNNYNCD